MFRTSLPALSSSKRLRCLAYLASPCCRFSANIALKDAITDDCSFQTIALFQILLNM